MHQPLPLELQEFGKNDIFGDLKPTGQINYLKGYLADMGLKTILLEPYYFDKDYLSEFSAFYATSARGYSNSCKRAHFFSKEFDRALLEKAVGGDKTAYNELQQAYLGFAVIRPIPSAPLGNTVISWYPDNSPLTPRIVTKRKYQTHVAGLKFEAEGLPWQQQDTGVGACATISIWSALHSSAFDEFHAIPTTAEITQAAHKTASLGTRVFPSKGLTVFQMCEAIKELGLSPIIQNCEFSGIGFSKERFVASCTSFLRSGYPVIVLGPLAHLGGHAVCLVGFRESKLQMTATGVVLEDGAVDTFYLHDDNVGPNIRYKIIENQKQITATQTITFVSLKPEPPSSPYSSDRTPDTTSDYFEITPQQLVVAVHNELRTSPDTLHKTGIDLSVNILALLNHMLVQNNQAIIPSLTVSSRFMKLSAYVGDELDRLMSNNPALLTKVRLALWENVAPMSLNLGVIRIGADHNYLADILFDTTDSDRNHPVFCCVVYHPIIGGVITDITTAFGNIYGYQINAF